MPEGGGPPDASVTATGAPDAADMDGMVLSDDGSSSAGAPSGDQGGCGCKAVGGTEDGGALPLLAALAGLVVVRSRHRRDEGERDA